MQQRSSLIEQTSTHNWTIPVCWRGEGIATTCTVVGSDRTEISPKSCPAWIYPERGGTGYYRIRVDRSTQSDITKLTAAERLTLIYDLRASKNITAPLLKILTTDPEPEIAKAASDLMAGK